MSRFGTLANKCVCVYVCGRSHFGSRRFGSNTPCGVEQLSPQCTVRACVRCARGCWGLVPPELTPFSRMGGERWNGGARGPSTGWGRSNGAGGGWVDYGSTKKEKEMNAQIVKLEKKFADLGKSTPQATAGTEWETGNPHSTAWACGCGFQNFRSRAVCMKCATAKPGAGAPGPGQLAAASPGGGEVPMAGANGGADVASKPDDQLAFWRNHHRYLLSSAAGPGKTQLLEQAEAKVAELTKEVKACKPLAARFQAAEARLQTANKTYGVALGAVMELEKQLQAACDILEKEWVVVTDAEADVLATRKELSAPTAATAPADPLSVIQLVLNQLVTMGVVQLAGTPQALEATLGTLVEKVLKPVPPPAPVDQVPELDGNMEVENGEGAAALARSQQGGPPLNRGPAQGVGPGSAVLAVASRMLKDASSSGNPVATQVLVAGAYGAQREKSDARTDL